MIRAVIFILFLFAGAASFASPPLVEKLEQETGLPVTLRQKEEMFIFSQKKHVALQDAQDILVKQLSQILSLPEKSLRSELFSELGTPRAELNPVTGAQLENLLGREMTKTEVELVDMAFLAFKEQEAAVYKIYSGEIANLVDLPQDRVQDLISR